LQVDSALAGQEEADSELAAGQDGGALEHAAWLEDAGLPGLLL
jgi:hypothetical protein